MTVAGRRPTSPSTSAASWSARHPVVVQSMTNTDTADADATALQVAALAHAGSRARARHGQQRRRRGRRAGDRRKLDDLGVGVPLIGDFHYNGHQLLVEYPEMAARARQVPHQPRQRRRQAPRRALRDHRPVAIDNDKPVRIGVNWGSLDQALLTELMDANAAPPSRATRAT